MKKTVFCSTCWTALIVLSLVVFGCGDSGKLLEQVSGDWQSNKGEGSVQIDLAGNTKTLVINGQAYPATIDKVDKSKQVVNLKVQNGGGQPETWSIRQVWDDTGDSYKLVLARGGQNDELSRKAKT